MTDKKDLNYVAQLEREISKKYGEETVVSPKQGWDDEKEKDYLEQSKALSARYQEVQVEKTEHNGVLVSKRLFTKEKDARSCPVCATYSFESKDDVYMRKFSCCFECYINYIEDREARWQSGWRPELEEEKNDGNNT